MICWFHHWFCIEDNLSQEEKKYIYLIKRSFKFDRACTICGKIDRRFSKRVRMAMKKEQARRNKYQEDIKKIKQIIEGNHP